MSRTFAVLREPNNQSDYLKKKKVYSQVCKNNCGKKVGSYEDYLNFKDDLPCYNSTLNKYNLISNLYTSENLMGVDVLVNAVTGTTPTNILYTSTPIYEEYYIEPTGGNNCRVNNYMNNVHFSLQK